jgi:hypothetical protein
LFKIHISMLTNLSLDMGSILAIPDRKESGDPFWEGTERWPLLMPLKLQEFEDFLLWMYCVFVQLSWPSSRLTRTQ